MIRNEWSFYLHPAVFEHFCLTHEAIVNPNIGNDPVEPPRVSGDLGAHYDVSIGASEWVVFGNGGWVAAVIYKIIEDSGNYICAVDIDVNLIAVPGDYDMGPGAGFKDMVGVDQHEVACFGTGHSK